MNVYMPPGRRSWNEERKQLHTHVRGKLQAKGLEVVSRTGGGRSLPWLQRAGAMVLETNGITPADEAESLYMAQELGREVLILFDRSNSVRGGHPSNRLLAASRRDRNENSHLWLVQYSRTVSPVPRMAIANLAISTFCDTTLGLSQPDLVTELAPEYDKYSF